MTPRLPQIAFHLVNRAAGLRARFWTGIYRPFLGRMGRGARLERVALLTNPHRIFLGDRVAVAHGARLEAFTHHRRHAYDGAIRIGDGTSIQPHVKLAAAAEMVIGRDVLMGTRVFITDHDHDFADPDVHVGEQALRVRPVRIEDFVWLGENVVVLKGVTVGHHAVVGANSVVTRDLPPFAVAAGVPARVLRVREPGAPGVAR